MATTGHFNDATLLGLAPELQKLIISDVFYRLPDAFENVMMTCKQLHDIGKEFITQHNKNVRSLRHFKYQSSRSLESNWQLMIDVFGKQPGLGRYVRTADLRHGHIGEDTFDDYSYKGPRFNDHRVSEYLDSDSRPLASELRRSFADGKDRVIPSILKWIPAGPDQQKRIEERLNNIDRDFYQEEDPLCVLPTLALMAMLPNVEELILPREWTFVWSQWRRATDESIDEQYHILSAAREQIVRLTHENLAKEQSLGLCKLKRVILDRPNVDGDWDHNLEYLYPVCDTIMMFVALCVVEEISASHGTFHREGQMEVFKWSNEYSSNLRVLELYDCEIHGGDRDFQILLSRLPKLEVLRYVLPESFGLDLRPFMAMIGPDTRCKLRELSISAIWPSADGWDQNFTRLERDGYISPLTGFAVLKKLNFDLRFLQYDDRTSLCLADILPGPYSDLHLQIFMYDLLQYEHDCNMRILKTLFNMTPEQQAQLKDCTVSVIPCYDDPFPHTSRFDWAPLKEAGVTEIRQGNHGPDWIQELSRRQARQGRGRR